MVKNNWITNEEMIDFYKFTNGNKQIWTYRVKETSDKTLKGRIDYVLGTPSLASAISYVRHIFHEYKITDHATTFYTIYSLPREKGPGVFRAHLSLLKHYKYKCLIDNTIKYTLLYDIIDKSCKFYRRNLILFYKKSHIKRKSKPSRGWRRIIIER